MRISEDCYARERLCLQLALRFLEHEARTHTIRAWTGLSDDRIRKIYNLMYSIEFQDDLIFRRDGCLLDS
jgi:hypothetical protein